MRVQKNVALLLALVLCLSMLFSISFIVIQSEHSCEGEHCDICSRIEACIHLLGKFALALVCLLCFFALRLLSAFIGKSFAHFSHSFTLVSLKVKLTI